MPKDSNYIYRLYMALKKFEDAAKTALIIARQEQDMGNYTLAHSVVVETIRQLEDEGIRVSLQLRTQFVLLHSYILVKRLVKRGDHNGAARMLLRVVQSVSKFPQHTVPILTSTVIECQRSGLKASSYEYAVMLMRPEYRSIIDVNLKRKIEAIVRRKSANTDESTEELSPCPISGEMIPGTQLECPSTRDAIPMCVVTGRHMVINDWCFCPVSRFPALYSEYVKYIEAELEAAAAAAEEVKDPEESKASRNAKKIVPLDPVLGKPVSLADLKKTTPEEAMKYIQKYNNVKEEKKDGEKEEDGDEENENVSDKNRDKNSNNSSSNGTKKQKKNEVTGSQKSQTGQSASSKASKKGSDYYAENDDSL